MHPYDRTIGSGWSIGAAVAGLLGVLLLLILRRRELKFASTAAMAGFLALLIGPLYWAATPITYGQNSMMPQAGPGLAGDRGGMGQFPGAAMGAEWRSGQGAGTGSGQGTGTGTEWRSGQGTGAGTGTGMGRRSGGERGAYRSDRANGNYNGNMGNMSNNGNSGNMGNMFNRGENQGVNNTLLSYLLQHNTGETYLFATTDYNTAAPYIIDAGQAVITLGGFSGSDPVYTPDKLNALVQSGQLKFFLISGGGMGGDRGSNSELTKWITEHGTVVPSAQWQPAGSGGNENAGFMRGGDRGGNMTLYEVKP
jgi:4-amino-4-deoxy-L-arabinose transferase-like glycosyltransferase